MEGFCTCGAYFEGDPIDAAWWFMNHLKEYHWEETIRRGGPKAMMRRIIVDQKDTDTVE